MSRYYRTYQKGPLGQYPVGPFTKRQEVVYTAIAYLMVAVIWGTVIFWILHLLWGALGYE